MPRSRPSYPPEFKHELVELARSGRSIVSLAREFGPHAQTIEAWVKQADLDEGRRSDGLTTAERQELVRLRRENRTLRMEREILKKAAAWFAKESDAIPKRDTDS
jgi:transposase